MSVTSQPIPYWRLSGFYFFFFASLGALLPFWGIYLDRLGYNAEQIGTVFAALMATKIISPNIWGWVADHTNRHVYVIRVAAFMAFFMFVGVVFFKGYLAMILIMAAFSFFWNATLPQFEAVTFHYMQNSDTHYSQVRLWGSVGFIVIVLAAGQYFKTEGALDDLPYIVLFFLAGLWGVTVLCPEKKVAVQHAPQLSIWKVLGQSRVIVLLLACFLIQVSHGPYYTFFSLYLESHQFSSSSIGWLWSLSVLSEVVIFFYVRRLFTRFNLINLMLCSIALTAVRWVLIAWFIDSLALLLVAQLLHAASFALFHVVAIQLISEFFPHRLQGRGQGLYSSISFGAGGALGAYYGGLLWESQGGNVFILSAGVSMIAFVLVLGCRELRQYKHVQ